MILGKPEEVLKKYNYDSITIGTLGSHSALNILKGAKEENFRTLCISTEENAIIYRRFNVADKIITVPHFKDLLDRKIQKRLLEMNTLLIPHGSYNAYIGSKRLLDKLSVPIYGNRELLHFETSRKRQLDWLQRANLRIPKILKSPDEIQSLTMVKLPGTKGGKGYFLVKNLHDFEEKIANMIQLGLLLPEDVNNAHLQEYVLGATLYPSYFRSIMKDSVELLSMDRRYESAVDGIGRIPAQDQLDLELNPSYTVVGNFPIVAREMLLKDFIEMGDKLVEASKILAPPGLIGPFCLETVVKDNLDIVAFEISARIVAGTNVGIGGSPYSYVTHGQNMYMGRRIAMEIKESIITNKLNTIIS